jgi:photosystem II stability/assembly factor-like uncharacterized protein
MREKLFSVLAAIACGIAPMAEGFAQGSFWQKVDGPSAGCSAITIDRDNRIYVQTQDQMYRSTNGGTSWIEDGPRIPGGASVLWVGSGEDLFAGGGEAGGVYLSSDRGESWRAAGMEGVSITSAAMTHDGALLVGTAETGVYYSNDRGLNWAQLLDGVQTGSVHSIVTTHEGDLFVATESGGILRSRDGGENWVTSTAGIPPGAIVDLAVDSQDRIYAATRSNGLFVSDDYGAHWDLVGMAKWTLGSLSISSSDGVYAAVSNPEPVLLRSTDRGATWEEVATGLSNAMVHDVVFDNRGYLFAATTRGVFRSVESTSSVSADAGHPGAGAEARLYPNPVMTPAATLELDLKSAGETSVTILSADGRVVARPFNGWLPSGVNRIEIDRTGLAAGNYLCSVRTASGVTSELLVVE